MCQLERWMVCQADVSYSFEFVLIWKLIYLELRLNNHVIFFHAHDLAAWPSLLANFRRVTNDCTYLQTVLHFVRCDTVTVSPYQIIITSFLCR